MIQDYQHLLHRPFVWGVTDCFAMVRQFYAENFGIMIPNYARPTNWRAQNFDLPRRFYDENGFVMITEFKLNELRPADLLLMAVGDTAANHFAIYVGDNKIIHHLYGRTSSEETLRDFWRDSTCYILRHSEVPDLRPTFPDTDIGSLLRARHRQLSDA